VTLLRAAAAFALLAASCGGSAENTGNPVTLRVSAASGLSQFVPGPNQSGSTAAALDLVYDPLDQHFASITADGASVLAQRSPSSPFTSEELARSFRFQGLRSAKAVDSGQVVLEFEDESTTAYVAYSGIDTGPFALAEQTADRVTLRGRHPVSSTAIEIIELEKTTRSDEWRKLMARQLDVIPMANSIYRREFEGLETVRLFDLAPTYGVALYFNASRPPFSNPSLRRRISFALRRKAIGRVSCGSAECAFPDPTPIEGGSPSEDPLNLRTSLVVFEGDSSVTFAAGVIQHQLAPLGVTLDIKEVGIAELTRQSKSGEYTIWLAPIPLGDLSYGFFLSPGHAKGMSLTGFANPAYDAAVEAGDLATAREIIEREVPVTRLYEPRAFAAVDARFCGDVTAEAQSWRWMAELRLCDDDAP
jgi:hypothetical protein